MIQLSGLTKAFGDRVLLDAVSWQIDDRERVGLAGPNGAGKTTLLKMLAGLDEPDAGAVVKPSGLAVGYLPQDGLNHSGRTLIEEAGLAFKPLLDMRAEIQSLEERLGDDTVAESEHAAMLSRYSELQENFRRLEGYSIDLKITTVLRGLGFTPRTSTSRAKHSPAAGRCASRWRSCCSTRPGLLLLDEPTNHLDLEARNWLEEYLADYPHAVILVSHDRFFLDAVVTRITEIGLRKLTDYAGNYSGYLRRARSTHGAAAPAEARSGRRDSSGCRRSSTASATRRPKRRRSRAGSRWWTRSCRSRSRPNASASISRFPPCAKSGRTVLDLRGVSQGVRHAAWCSTASTCTSNAAIASRSSARTAPANRR